MNPLPSSESLANATKQNLYPIDLLAELSGRHVSGCLRIESTSCYFIHLEKGKIAYATNSVDPFERLERHLRRLSHNIPSLTRDIRNEVKLKFESDRLEPMAVPPEYQAVTWLIEEKYLDLEQAANLVKMLVQEVFENFLLLPSDYKSRFLKQTPSVSLTGLIELATAMKSAQASLRAWQGFYPQITSSYQRPYFFSKQTGNPEHQKIARILKGFSFRQLAAILNQSEIAIAKKFFPLIANKTIVLRSPQPPFDKLPHWSKEIATITEKSDKQAVSGKNPDKEFDLADIPSKSSAEKEWKIVCIDDSPTILNEISRFLERDEFSVFPITEPLKALMKIIRIKPDLILLDVGMPNIDGYKLCTLIRKYSAFKNTPIVMVTGNKGLIDRAKARMAGATDYMTKPFTQSDLLDMVFRYLS